MRARFFGSSRTQANENVATLKKILTSDRKEDIALALRNIKPETEKETELLLKIYAAFEVRALDVIGYLPSIPERAQGIAEKLCKDEIYTVKQAFAVLLQLLLKRHRVQSCIDQLLLCVANQYISNAQNRFLLNALNVLFESGASVNTLFVNEQTLLHYAAVRGDLAMATLLFNHHAIVDAVSTIASTPLFVAVSHRRLGVARLLVQRGANTQQTDSFGRCIADVAAENPDMLRLIKSGVDQEMKNRELPANVTPARGLGKAGWPSAMPRLSSLSFSRSASEKTLPPIPRLHRK